jgi:protein CLEC16A
MQDEVTSFPLYVEALKFAFHEDSMIRVAIRTLTLNVYHGIFVGPSLNILLI